jgi:glycerol-3-phosphate dehydrogenase (NAD(P)+)
VVDPPPAAPTATVIGAGSWGTVFAAVMADAGCRVRLWARDAGVAAQIAADGRNERYLPGVLLPRGITATTDAAAALRGADVVAVAVPSRTARTLLSGLRRLVPDHAVVASLMKGLEQGTDAAMSTVVAEALAIPDGRVAVVSGPNLAREIADHQPTATVVASVEPRTARYVARACTTSYFRPYTNDDVVGVELCGAVKNVIALAVGMAQGRGYGDNTTATLITRGLVEITRLGTALGADPATFVGLAGMGDLVATCASPQSRNHGLGRLIGEGASLSEARARTATTAEGVETCRTVLELARSYGVEMPITAGVVDVLYHGLPVDSMAAGLLGRPMRTERPAPQGLDPSWVRS